MIFYWNLSDSKYNQVSKSLLIIFADFNSAVLLMVFVHLLIYNSLNLLFRSLLTVSYLPKAIIITVTCMSCRFFGSLTVSTYASIFSLSFILMFC